MSFEKWIKNNKSIWIGGIIGFLLGVFQVGALSSKSDFLTLFLFGLFPAVSITLVGLFVGYLVKKKFYRSLLVYLILLFASIISLFISNKELLIYVLPLSVPTPYSIFMVYISIVAAAVIFTYGIGGVGALFVSLIIPYFATKSIKDDNDKVLPFLVIMLQVFILFGLIIILSGILPEGLT